MSRPDSKCIDQTSETSNLKKWPFNIYLLYFFPLSAASEMTGTADTLSAQNWPTQSDLRNTIYINSKVHQPNCKGHHEIQADMRSTQQIQVLRISFILCIFICKRSPSILRNKYLLGYPIVMGIILRRVSCVKTMSFCDWIWESQMKLQSLAIVRKMI